MIETDRIGVSASGTVDLRSETLDLKLAPRVKGGGGFDLSQLSYEYPHEPVPEGWGAQDWLEHITYAAALQRFPGGIPDKLQKLLDE